MQHAARQLVRTNYQNPTNSGARAGETGAGGRVARGQRGREKGRKEQRRVGLVLSVSQDAQGAHGAHGVTRATEPSVEATCLIMGKCMHLGQDCGWLMPSMGRGNGTLATITALCSRAVHTLRRETERAGEPRPRPDEADAGVSVCAREREGECACAHFPNPHFRPGSNNN